MQMTFHFIAHTNPIQSNIDIQCCECAVLCEANNHPNFLSCIFYLMQPCVKRRQIISYVSQVEAHIWLPKGSPPAL